MSEHSNIDDMKKITNKFTGEFQRAPFEDDARVTFISRPCRRYTNILRKANRLRG